MYGSYQPLPIYTIGNTGGLGVVFIFNEVT